MANNKKKGGVKSAQVNNGQAEAAAAAAAAQVNNGTPAQKSNTSSSDAQATVIGVLHDRFYKDENAAEHTGLPQGTVDKINEVNAIAAAVWMCQEVANGNSNFAATMRVGMLEKIKEIAPTIPGLNIDETKLLPGSKEGTVVLPATAVEITEETKTALNEDAAAQQAANGKTYKVEELNDTTFKEALNYLMTTHDGETIIDNLNKAVELYREYKLYHDKKNSETYKNMSKCDIFLEIRKLTGKVGILGSGIGNWSYFVTVSFGTPVPAFCSLRNSAYDEEKKEYKYSDQEVADLVKMLVVSRANMTIEEHKLAISKLDKKDKKYNDDVATHNNAIKHAEEAINMMSNCNADYMNGFADKFNATDAKERNGVHRVITGIMGSYFKDLSKEKIDTIKQDSLVETTKYYIGYITNLFREPSNQLTDFNIGLAPEFVFKTNKEIEEEVKAAKAEKKAKAESKAKDKASKSKDDKETKSPTKKQFDRLKLNAHNQLIVL